MPTAVDLPGLPAFLDTSLNSDAILSAMRAALPPGIDSAEGSFLWDALAPVALELAIAAANAQQTLEFSFAETTFGAYLDLRAAEHGVTRLAAVKATGTVRFSGVAATAIPAGTVVSTASSTAVPAVLFQTVGLATIGGGGTVDVPVVASVAGLLGNVVAGAISFLGSPIAGISGLTNPAATAGGLDAESDAALLNRYLIFVASPAAGGNAADYADWALSVNGVGKVVVVPLWQGPGTVEVVIVDSNLALPSQALLDQVQTYIAPPLVVASYGGAFTLGGFGASYTPPALGNPPNPIVMVYNASGDGTARILTFQTLLAQPGAWQARLSAKVNATAQVVALLDFGVWNTTTGTWAQTTLAGGVDSHLASPLHASQLSTGYTDVILPFYWNGTDALEVRATRKVADTATTLSLLSLTARSSFSDRLGAGKAPIGAQVSVVAPSTVAINVAATLTIDPAYVVGPVRAAATAAVSAYLASIVFAPTPTVRYTKIATAILDTPGIVDYAALLVNGGTANVAIAAAQIPVLGTVTWS